MNDVSSERSNPWNIHTTSDPSPSQEGGDRGDPWTIVGTSMNMNGISFGFVATAILLSIFLIIAILELLIKPNHEFPSPENLMDDSPESGPIEKHGNPQTLSASCASDFPVLMPGQQYPTYLAHPTPLPCPREGIYWPSHGPNS
ncbi:Multidrug resistance 3 [Quillaja saponaria]|uniref:Multidrug resistance 3 n=1 Tax=Quillaja saponaria TaxID=32244 RepID=A0AAD7KX66_QUISA|nr:Multidrug resistance 3 [Quillaja saponaria]KAJ7946570.1 Multidrug resistance 3 [Quillaja saponaria]